ncbi:hypothetical protein WHR41_04707 [Cladosporium halotolerans]|uniref:J domain-containing protein n=1 Tax=Cladosporium halotolerans TaxID=1052096 RepID=A0AB34KM21_9PEZI
MADKKHDHYAVLGIEHGATAQDINRAYKRAAAKAHPDKGGTHEKMIAVTAARDALLGSGGEDSGIEDDGEAATDDDPETTDFGEDDEGYFEGEDGFSDGDYVEGAEDEGECDSDYGYGDLEETGGNYKVVIEGGGEVSLEYHEQICGCDLDDESSVHYLSGE